MKKLINCKTCGAQMARDAKVCPQCGAKNKMPAWAVIAITILSVIIVVAIISMFSEEPVKNENVPANNTIDTNANKLDAASSDSQNQETTANSPESQAQETTEVPSSAMIGESYKCGDWTICVHSIEFTKRYEYSQFIYYEAEDGQQYLRMNISVTNNGTANGEFLPYLDLGSGVSAKLKYKDEYTYSLVFNYLDDEIYGKSIPALATQTGYIQFKVPDAVADDAANAKVIFKDGKDSVTYLLG